MPTPSHDDHGNRLISDEQWERYGALSEDQLAALPAEEQKAIKDTSYYHFQQRQADFSMEGMDIGGRPASEVLAERRAARGTPSP